MDKTTAKAEMIAWLYVHDGKYPDKLDWRKDFVLKLNEVIDKIECK